MAEDNALTSAQVAVGFNVTLMTIFTWRKGAAGRDPLPELTARGGGRRVRFSLHAVTRWAAKHNLAFDTTAATSAQKRVAGPKPRPA